MWYREGCGHVMACVRGQLPGIGPFPFSFTWVLGLKSGSRLDWPVPLTAELSIFLALANLHGKVIMAFTSLTSKSAIQRASKSVTF